MPPGLSPTGRPPRLRGRSPARPGREWPSWQQSPHGRPPPIPCGRGPLVTRHRQHEPGVECSARWWHRAGEQRLDHVGSRGAKPVHSIACMPARRRLGVEVTRCRPGETLGSSTAAGRSPGRLLHTDFRRCGVVSRKSSRPARTAAGAAGRPSPIRSDASSSRLPAVGAARPGRAPAPLPTHSVGTAPRSGHRPPHRSRCGRRLARVAGHPRRTAARGGGSGLAEDLSTSGGRCPPGRARDPGIGRGDDSDEAVRPGVEAQGTNRGGSGIADGLSGAGGQPANIARVWTSPRKSCRVMDIGRARGRCTAAGARPGPSASGPTIAQGNCPTPDRAEAERLGFRAFGITGVRPSSDGSRGGGAADLDAHVVNDENSLRSPAVRSIVSRVRSNWRSSASGPSASASR